MENYLNSANPAHLDIDLDSRTTDRHVTALDCKMMTTAHSSLMETQNSAAKEQTEMIRTPPQRITEWLGLGGTSGDHLAQKK